LRGRKISYENDLFEVFEEDIVPSGVAEVSYLQQQGYTYIKPKPGMPLSQPSANGRVGRATRVSSRG
jgi:hypothetical protein